MATHSSSVKSDNSSLKTPDEDPSKPEGKRKATAEVKKEQMVKKERKVKKACGLCGKTRNLIKTECCDNWICNDEHKYVLFSYARNSCSRNHRRYTICAFHYNEGHTGDWQDCNKCKDNFDDGWYAEYTCDEYNFVKSTKS